MSRYDRDAIEIYILDHIDTDNYGKQFKYDREYLSFMLNVFKDEYKEHIKRDGIKKAFEDYIMSVPSIFRIHIANCDIRYLLRSWGVEFADDPRNPAWTRVLDECKAAGYDGIELGPIGFMPFAPRSGRASGARSPRGRSCHWGCGENAPRRGYRTAS